MDAPTRMWLPHGDRTNIDEFRELVNQKYNRKLGTLITFFYLVHIIMLIFDPLHAATLIQAISVFVHGCVSIVSMVCGACIHVRLSAHFNSTRVCV